MVFGFCFGIDNCSWVVVVGGVLLPMVVGYAWALMRRVGFVGFRVVCLRDGCCDAVEVWVV